MSSHLFTPWSPQAERAILQKTLTAVRDATLHPYNRFYICAAVKERVYHLDREGQITYGGLPSYVDYYFDDENDHQKTRGLWASLTNKSPKVKDEQKRLNFFIRAVKRLQSDVDKKRKPMDWRKLLLKRRGEVPDWNEILERYGILAPLVLCLAGLNVPGAPSRIIPQSLRARMTWFPPHIYSQRATAPHLSIYWDTIRQSFPLGEIDKLGMIHGDLTLDDLFITYINGIESCMSSYDNLVPDRKHRWLPFADVCECQQYRALHWLLGMEQPKRYPGHPLTPEPSPSPSLSVGSPRSSRSSSPRRYTTQRNRW
ncbi:hypothetical protein CALVIDRAFT_568484 [Calocera viscosa TUFC12733]|uniref:Uncharacterized protein n=1 Tax=Calocera viscosa (strain TUFC12733) TaxID=1330018 RepID=A0A167H0V6_CALVF|nr:hypothetical protein CALVIDRAFT_568484 [Calocera viscosa TUFC12733]